MSDLWTWPAGDLARAIARGEISSVEAVSAHIARIEGVDGRINAVVVRRFEAALAEARSADDARAQGATLGPLHGVPVSIKESIDLEGTPTTLGILERAGDRAPADDRFVARWRAAGAIPIGKTNVPQLTIYIESDNPLYGRTNNPWNIARSPGGSSGGEGALIAAGGSPLGLGSDIGGSLRSPATSNGVVSLKPTSGRLDNRGRLRLFSGETTIPSQAGPLARTVADVAVGYALAANVDVADVPLAGLRVGVYETLPGFDASEAFRRAAREAAALLAARGAHVVPFAPPDPEHAMDLFYRVLAADGGAGAKRDLGKSPRDPRVAAMLDAVGRSRRSLGPLVLLLRLSGERSIARVASNYGYRSARDFWDATAATITYRDRFEAALDDAEGGALDLLVCPPCGLPALRHGSSASVLTAGAYAPLYNVLGYPCGTVPFTRVRADEESQRKPRSRDRMLRSAAENDRGSAGLPIGVQLVGRPWREDVVLSAMRALEEDARVRPDFPRTPVTPAYEPDHVSG